MAAPGKLVRNRLTRWPGNSPTEARRLLACPCGRAHSGHVRGPSAAKRVGDRVSYRAFISYSHRDNRWADWLLNALESYRIPKHLIGEQGREGPVPARLFPVFRDRDELPASSDLSERILKALEASACQIVICSPHAAKSRWVNEEIISFKRLGREDRIFAFIVDGEPNAQDGGAECFPRALRFRIDGGGGLSALPTEPIAADARAEGDGRNNAKLKLIAGLLGIEYAALKRRDEQAVRRRARLFQAIAAGMALLAMLAAGAGVLAYQKQREAEYQRDQTIQAQSRALTQTAAVTLKDGGVATALSILREVLSRSRPGAPIDPLAFGTFCEGAGA
jgi:hypothetical protein